MNRELLEKPFDPEQIKQREGSFGKMLDYIEGHSVIQRLNDAFDAKWSFEIARFDMLEDKDEIIVLGKLTANGIVKSQFGSSRITKARETGEVISLADDLKAAATDAIKKCATLMGVGLHLYNNDGNPTGRQQSSSSNHSDGRNNSRHGGNSGNDGNRSKGNNSHGNNRISSKQHKYILNLIKGLVMTRSELNQQCVKAYGSVLDHISRSDASSLIEELLAQ
jgi:hypothetical protein